MRRYRVTQNFQAKERYGPFIRTVATGEELMFMQWVGEKYEQSAIFAIVVNGPAGVAPGPQYETPRAQFEGSTERA